MNVAEHTAPDRPLFHEDGTINAILIGTQEIAGALALDVALPAGVPRDRLAGRYFLIRCVDPTPWNRAHDWTIFLRRPLYAARWRPPSSAGEESERWFLISPLVTDVGITWLAGRSAGAAINLLGPLGNGFLLPPRARQLAVVSEPARVPILLPLVHDMLDRGGRVVILLRGASGIDVSLRSLLPFSAEVHQEPSQERWENRLREVLSWADFVATALPGTATTELGEALRAARLRAERDLVHTLVDARLVCGYGACHACVTPLARGRWTRACVHGPVFDLADLAGDGK